MLKTNVISERCGNISTTLENCVILHHCHNIGTMLETLNVISQCSHNVQAMLCERVNVVSIGCVNVENLHNFQRCHNIDNIT